VVEHRVLGNRLVDQGAGPAQVPQALWVRARRDAEQTLIVKAAFQRLRPRCPTMDLAARQLRGCLLKIGEYRVCRLFGRVVCQRGCELRQ
jgi:hypothetical protein